MKNYSTRNISDFFSPPVAVLCCRQQLIVGSYTIFVSFSAICATPCFVFPWLSHCLPIRFGTETESIPDMCAKHNLHQGS